MSIKISADIYNDDYILLNIINQLDQKTKVIISHTNRRLNHLANKSLYRKIYINDTPIVKSNVINIEASWSFLGNNNGYGQGEIVSNIRKFISSITPKEVTEGDMHSYIRHKNIINSIEWIRFNWDANQILQLEILSLALKGTNLQRIENMVYPFQYQVLYANRHNFVNKSLEQAPPLSRISFTEYMNFNNESFDEHRGAEIKSLGFDERFGASMYSSLLNETLLSFKMYLNYIYRNDDLPLLIDTISTFIDPALVFSKPDRNDKVNVQGQHIQGLIYSDCIKNVFAEENDSKVDLKRNLPKLKIKDLKLHWRDDQFPINQPQYLKLNDEEKLPKLKDLFYNDTLETVTIISWDPELGKRNETVLFELLEFTNIKDLSLISLEYKPDLIARFFDKNKNKFLKTLNKLKLDFQSENGLKNIPFEDLTIILNNCPNLTFLDIRSEYDYENKATLVKPFTNNDNYNFSGFKSMATCHCLRCEDFLQNDLIKKNMLNIKNKPDCLYKLNIFDYLSSMTMLPYSKSVAVYPSVLTNQSSSLDLCVKNALLKMDNSHGFDISRHIDNIKFIPNEFVDMIPQHQKNEEEDDLIVILYLKLQVMKRLYLEFYEDFSQGYGYDIKEELINLSFLDCSNNTGMDLSHIKNTFITPDFIFKAIHYYYHYQKDFIHRVILKALPKLKYLVFNECSFYVVNNSNTTQILKPLFYDEGYYESEDLEKYNEAIKKSDLIKNQTFNVDELAVLFRFQTFQTLLFDGSMKNSMKNTALEAILAVEKIFEEKFEALEEKYKDSDIPLGTIQVLDSESNLGSFLKEKHMYKDNLKSFVSNTPEDLVGSTPFVRVGTVVKQNITGIRESQKELDEIKYSLKKRAYIYNLPFNFYDYISNKDLTIIKGRVNRLMHTFTYYPNCILYKNGTELLHSSDGRKLDAWGRDNEEPDKYKQYFRWEDEYYG
ncbi:hypothetical protein QEN19_003556 [Hanseniaspora menglaensis]